MLTTFIRVFSGASDSGNPESIELKDLSMENAEQIGFAVDEKYLYVAQKFPFNNLFLKVGSIPNTLDSKIKVETWNHAEEWIEAVDVLDFSRGIKKSGLLQFSLDPDHSWDCIPDTDLDSTQCPEELKGKFIDDCHWVRLSFDVLPVNDTNPEDIKDVLLERICYAFTTTKIVNGADKQAVKYMATFGQTKTDWMDEIIMGSEMMISEMKTSGMLKSAGQIIMLDDFYLPCAWRVLEHIYTQMGVAYDGKRGECKALYKKFLSGDKTIDKDMNARAERSEVQTSQPRLRR